MLQETNKKSSSPRKATIFRSNLINHHLFHLLRRYYHRSIYLYNRYRNRDFMLFQLVLLATVVTAVSMVPMVDSISYSVPISKHTQPIVKELPPDSNFFDNNTLIRESMDGMSTAGWLNLCKNWTQSPNSLYYHITYGLFLIGFLAPANFVGWIWLRMAVVVGSLIMFYWGWFHECDQDTVIWSTLFFIVNFIYLTLALIKLRPVKFDKEIEAVSSSYSYIKHLKLS